MVVRGNTTIMLAWVQDQPATAPLVPRPHQWLDGFHSFSWTVMTTALLACCVHESSKVGRRGFTMRASNIRCNNH